jgi:hypothetical protein
MRYFWKSFTVIVIMTLALTSVVFVKSACASAPKPSVPQFTVTYVPSSYTKTTTNPYTGQETNEQIDTSTIEVKIKNQPFDYSVGDVKYYIFYQIGAKGHFSDDWSSRYSYGSNLTYDQASSQFALKQNETSQYTTAIFPANYYAAKSQVDFRVQAVIMYDGLVKVYNSDDWVDLSYHLEKGYVFGETGDWSSIQTITTTVGASTETPSIFSSSTPTNSPSQPTGQSSQNTILFGLGWEQVALLVLAVFVAVLLVVVAVLMRKVNGLQNRVSQN